MAAGRTDSEPDVAVVGAGPAGATIARLLALRGRRVTVIDAGRAVTDRLELLSPSSLPVLEALALAALLDDPAMVLPCAGIRRRWGSTVTELDDFFRHPGGRGFVIDRRRFDAALRTMALASGARLLQARAVAVRRVGTGFEIETSGTAEAPTIPIQAPIVVDASGRPAVLARGLGARRSVSERLLAERRGVERGHDVAGAPSWLEVDSAPRSWSYSIAGPDGRRESWTVYRDDGRRRRGAGLRVNAASSCLSHAAGPGWIAVGDAASAFDPIASQGLANALSSALVAAGAILSPDGLSADSASGYCEIVAATFANSERGRRAVYDALAKRQAAQPREPMPRAARP